MFWLDRELSSYSPVSDELILAAVDRAKVHRTPHLNHSEVAHHLGFAGKMCDPVGFVQGVSRECGTSLALTPTAMASVNDEGRPAQPIPQLATGASTFHDVVQGHGLQFLFSEVPEFVENGITSSKCRRPITDRLPAEAITDYVNSSVGYPTCSTPFAAGSPVLVFERK